MISASLAGATAEPGEPIIPGVSTGQTAWWTWIAPSNGLVTISANGTSFDPLLAVYTGTELSSLSLIASNNYVSCYTNSNCGCHWRVRRSANFRVSAGLVYQLAVDSALYTDAQWGAQLATTNASHGPRWTTNVLSSGVLSLEFQFSPTPRNDEFEFRTELRGSRLGVRASNWGATRQTNEPSHLGNPGGSSVWYSWKAPASGRVTLSTNQIPPYRLPTSGSFYGVVTVINLGPNYCGNEQDQNPPPAFFPIFAAYTGASLASLVPANNLPLSLTNYPHAISFDAIGGQTYQIAFDGNMGTVGDISLHLALTRPALNDNFKRRIKLHSVHAVATGYNAGATAEEAEPSMGDASTGKTVWWLWTAPVSGDVSIDLRGSDYSFPVAVFTGSTIAELRSMASGTNAISFPAVAGRTYQIAVGDESGHTGAINLDLQAPVNEVPLSRMLRTAGNKTLLCYAAEPGQVILLLRSNDGVHWTHFQTVVARTNTATFLIRPTPEGSGFQYRAIIVDRVF